MSLKEQPLERVLKGVANHRRIEILRLVAREPGLSLSAIAEQTGVGVPTTQEHVRRLHAAGLVSKARKDRRVEHVITPIAEAVLHAMERVERQLTGKPPRRG